MPSKLYELTHATLDIGTRGGILIQKDDYTVIAYEIPDLCVSDIYYMFAGIQGVTVHVKAVSSGMGGLFVVVEQKPEINILKSAEFLFLLECISIFAVCYSYARGVLDGML